METLYRIQAGHFVAGCIVSHNFVISAAPIVKYMIGWKEQAVKDYCLKKGWDCARCGSD